MDSSKWVTVYEADSNYDNIELILDGIRRVVVGKNCHLWIRKRNIAAIVLGKIFEWRSNNSHWGVPEIAPILVDNKGREYVPAAFFDEHPDDRGDFEQRVLGPLFFDE